MFIWKIVFLFYLPEDGQFCETLNQKHGDLYHKFLECKYFVGFYVYNSCIYK